MEAVRRNASNGEKKQRRAPERGDGEVGGLGDMGEKDIEHEAGVHDGGGAQTRGHLASNLRTQCLVH